MFYDNYVKLCNKVKKAPSAVAYELGYERTVTYRWSKGSKPRYATLLRIADYFGVTVEELTGELKEKPAALKDDELIRYLDMLRTRPECRMLFSLADGATKDDVEKAVAIIEALRKAEGK